MFLDRLKLPYVNSDSTFMNRLNGVLMACYFGVLLVLRSFNGYYIKKPFVNPREVSYIVYPILLVKRNFLI